MSTVHPMFQNLLNAVSGKHEPEPKPVIFSFDVEARAEFDGGKRSALVTWHDNVEAMTEDEACDLAAREIFREITARAGSKPTAVTVLKSNVTREEA
jgi:hypothetical protein